jgi:hypothetical protein
MYYLPRRFFQDFINIGGVFASVQVFHEIGLPTIFNIIDKTYSAPAYITAATEKGVPGGALGSTALTRWTDCWGNCCKGGAIAEDILEHRCGHHLDFLNWEVTRTHFDRLKADALLLGSDIPAEKDVYMSDKGPIFMEHETMPAGNNTETEEEELEAVHRFMLM